MLSGPTLSGLSLVSCRSHRAKTRHRKTGTCPVAAVRHNARRREHRIRRRHKSSTFLHVCSSLTPQTVPTLVTPPRHRALHARHKRDRAMLASIMRDWLAITSGACPRCLSCGGCSEIHDQQVLCAYLISARMTWNDPLHGLPALRPNRERIQYRRFPCVIRGRVDLRWVGGSFGRHPEHGHQVSPPSVAQP